jgi:hypothetical protein
MDTVPPSLAREHLKCSQYTPIPAPTPLLTQRPAVLLNPAGLARTRGLRGSFEPVPERVRCSRVRVRCDVIKPVRDPCSTLWRAVSTLSLFPASGAVTSLKIVDSELGCRRGWGVGPGGAASLSDTIAGSLRRPIGEDV